MFDGNFCLLKEAVVQCGVEAGTDGAKITFLKSKHK